MKTSMVKRALVSVTLAIVLATIFAPRTADACWYQYQYQYVCDFWGRCVWQYVWVCL